MERLGIYGNLIFMTVVYVAAFMVFMALGPAHAQRCPAGADSFGSCLPLDHRYGGPGESDQAGRRVDDRHCRHRARQHAFICTPGGLPTTPYKDQNQRMCSGPPRSS
jgi:hypothetical protein